MRTLYTSVLAVTGLLVLQTQALGLEKLEGENCEPDTEGPDPDIDFNLLKFAKRRCNDRQLNRQGGAKNLCDDCNSSPIDGTCSWSIPLLDPMKNVSDDAACRCNPHIYFFAKEVKPTKCNTGRFPGCPEGETCHKSWPWYDKMKGKSQDASFRCKYSLDNDDETESEEEQEESEGDEQEESEGDEQEESDGDGQEESEGDEQEESDEDGQEESEGDEQEESEGDEQEESEGDESEGDEQEESEGNEQEEDEEDENEGGEENETEGGDEEENKDPDEDQDDQDEQDQDDEEQDEEVDPISEEDEDEQPVVDCGEAFDDFNDIQLCAHNQKRALHVDTDPLVLDEDLAAQALDWSMNLAAIGQLKHSDSDDRVGQGENLAWNSSTNAPDTWSANSWYNEVSYYDFQNPSWPGEDNQGNDQAIGHFTQMVWTDSKKLGCGEFQGYVTCRYSPPGNMNFGSQAVNKVKPLK